MDVWEGFCVLRWDRKLDYYDSCDSLVTPLFPEESLAQFCGKDYTGCLSAFVGQSQSALAVSYPLNVTHGSHLLQMVNTYILTFLKFCYTDFQKGKDTSFSETGEKHKKKKISVK